jgi:hypothetical protein
MTTPLRFLRRAEDVLSLMRERPSTRIIALTDKRHMDGGPVYAVADRIGFDVPAVTILAYVSPRSEAEKLFRDAMGADADPANRAAWEALPVRFHAAYGACLLPAHPDAPAAPGTASKGRQKAGLVNAGIILVTRRPRPPRAAPGSTFADDLSPEERAAFVREVFEDHDRCTLDPDELPEDGPDNIPF